MNIDDFMAMMTDSPDVNAAEKRLNETCGGEFALVFGFMLSRLIRKGLPADDIALLAFKTEAVLAKVNEPPDA